MLFGFCNMEKTGLKDTRYKSFHTKNGCDTFPSLFKKKKKNKSCLYSSVTSFSQYNCVSALNQVL